MDKRKNNGGHSTKSKGVDRRKNEYRKALEMASTVEDVKNVILKLKNVALSKGDVQAIKLYLEYYLGKPKESIDLDATVSTSQNFNAIMEILRGDKS